LQRNVSGILFLDFIHINTDNISAIVIARSDVDFTVCICSLYRLILDIRSPKENRHPSPSAKRKKGAGRLTPSQSAKERLSNAFYRN
jgi:hypothetical protein